MAMGQNRMGTFSVGSLTTSLKGLKKDHRGYRVLTHSHNMISFVVVTVVMSYDDFLGGLDFLGSVSSYIFVFFRDLCVCVFLLDSIWVLFP